MPNLVEFKRNNALNAINENPETITFNRKTYSINESTGGKDIVESSYTENIRITKNNNVINALNTDIGNQVEDNDLVLLGTYESNMQKTKNIEDSFVYGGFLYKITSVMKNKEKSFITSVQAKAKVIK